MKALAVAALAATLAGCGSTHAPERYYVLDAPPPAAHAQPASVAAATLMVAPTTAARFYDTQDIVYSRSPGTRAYYRLSHWTEPPSRRVAALLTERLRGSGAFGTVVAATDGVRATLLLRTHIDEIYHDAATSPGSVRITLSAMMSEPARRSIVDRRTFSASVPVATEDAAGAVQGFDRVLASLLDDVAGWAGDAASRMRLQAEADPTYAQASPNDMWLRGNSQATRQRTDRELREKREAGVIKRWSPDALVVPLKPLPPAEPGASAVAAPPHEASSSPRSPPKAQP
jgi:cholesterol transport system auxiliary component